jgi:RNA polymerase sigma-70 factor (ECF subfamily)
VIETAANIMDTQALLPGRAGRAAACEQLLPQGTQADDKGLSRRASARANRSEGEELPEAEAIRRAQQGDEAALERLYRLHSPRVYALCLRMVKDAAEAEELTQEAFYRLFRKIATFRGESAFSTWLHRLCVNVVLMRLRKKTLPETSLEETTEPNAEAGGRRKEIGGPDLLLTGLIDRLNLRRAIERLPDGYKIMFVLHDIEGYEHREVAKMLGCSIGNTKSQLHKARMRLRKLLQETERQKAGQARSKARGAGADVEPGKGTTLPKLRS